MLIKIQSLKISIECSVLTLLLLTVFSLKKALQSFVLEKFTKTLLLVLFLTVPEIESYWQS